MKPHRLASAPAASLPVTVLVSCDASTRATTDGTLTTIAVNAEVYSLDRDRPGAEAFAHDADEPPSPIDVLDRADPRPSGAVPRRPRPHGVDQHSLGPRAAGSGADDRDAQGGIHGRDPESAASTACCSKASTGRTDVTSCRTETPDPHARGLLLPELINGAVFLVLAAVRHPRDVRRRAMAYTATPAGTAGRKRGSAPMAEAEADRPRRTVHRAALLQHIEELRGALGHAVRLLS
ncbi:hypothetical protein [Streptomyces sp. NPDC001787]|uniref:hypothetical protein n=1 Tax=Streptomyces sp. NPDC001787 TaxID=3154523 RepID=UPI00331CF8B4